MFFKQSHQLCQLPSRGGVVDKYNKATRHHSKGRYQRNLFFTTNFVGVAKFPSLLKLISRFIFSDSETFQVSFWRQMTVRSNSKGGIQGRDSSEPGIGWDKIAPEAHSIAIIDQKNTDESCAMPVRRYAVRVVTGGSKPFFSCPLPSTNS